MSCRVVAGRMDRPRRHRSAHRGRRRPLTGLLEELSVKPRKRRLLARILEEMPPEQAEDIRAALKMPSISNGRISRLLTRIGYKISESAVRDYRMEEGHLG